MAIDSTLVFEAGCLLGEGISWHAGSPAWPTPGFFFVDIETCQLHFVALDRCERSTWTLPERIGWWIPARDGLVWYAGLQSGIAKVRLLPKCEIVGWVERLFEYHQPLRLNDAKADEAGRVWAGSMNHVDESRPEGALWQFSYGRPGQVADAGYTVPNGPAILPKASLMLHANSGQRVIYAFEFDVSGGRIANKRVWATLDETEGFPDGMCFDAEGCLWLAHWGGGQVTRRDLSGRVIARVRFPVTNISNVSFGGKSLDRLWVTTARVGLSAERLVHEPLAGSVFEVLQHGTRGMPVCTANL